MGVALTYGRNPDDFPFLLKQVIIRFIVVKDGTAWMDFAANQRYVVSQTELPVMDKNRPEVLKGVVEPMSDRAKELMRPRAKKMCKKNPFKEFDTADFFYWNNPKSTDSSRI